MFRFIFIFSCLVSNSFAFEPKNKDQISLYKEEKAGLSLDITADRAVSAMQVLREHILKTNRPRLMELGKDYRDAVKNKDRANYNYEVHYSATWANDTHLSMYGSAYSFTGGAHGSTNFPTAFFDLVNKRDIAITELLPELTKPSPFRDKFFTFITQEILKEKLLREDNNESPTAKQLEARKKDDFILNELKSAEIEHYANFTLKGRGKENTLSRTKAIGLTFYYPHYAMGAYAEGLFIVDVPLAVFKDHIAPQFRAFFE